jgi:D-alanine-D-alanine ligase
MNNDPVIAVLSGGTSAERDVSIGSGRASAMALARSYPTRSFELTSNALPPGLDPKRHVVFSTLHGTFGEDGQMQRLMEEAGVAYAGCDAVSSALTMNKSQTKARVGAAGVPCAASRVFAHDAPPEPSAVIGSIGPELVLKPNAEGSSVGLRLIENAGQLKAALAQLTPGEWMIERRIRGREMSVGVLNGEPMGIVEIRPKSGVYDYTSKYTKGMTEYFAPAPLSAAQTALVQSAAKTAFAACGCRDYARVDFIFSGEDQPFFLEINTLPGMKETSLLPMSARCVGFDFVALVRELVKPALERFRSAALRSA